MKLLVLVHNHFNDMELVSVLSVLKRSEKVEEIAYFNPHYDKANGHMELLIWI
ncbi:hypothetical protein [Mycoplasmopsis bovis]|uniref:hypothetical protein n=1 Tax=Mycoplasmopsis bovis TaxID=28903 RepID=UPI0030186AB5